MNEFGRPITHKKKACLIPARPVQGWSVEGGLRLEFISGSDVRLTKSEL